MWFKVTDCRRSLTNATKILIQTIRKVTIPVPENGAFPWAPCTNPYDFFSP